MSVCQHLSLKSSPRLELVRGVKTVCQGKKKKHLAGASCVAFLSASDGFKNYFDPGFYSLSGSDISQ